MTIPMLLIGCALATDATRAEPGLAYRIALMPGPAIEVALRFAGDADGRTDLPRARATIEIEGAPSILEFDAVGPESVVRSYAPPR